MSYTLAPIPLTVNVTTLVTIPGDMGAVSWVKLTNASPYLIQLSNLGAGSQDYLQPGECNVWPVPGLRTAIQAYPLEFVTNPTIVPASVLVVTWYGTGEQPAGTYPVNFNLLQFVGNSAVANTPANAFEQDLFTPFVLTGITPTKDGSIANQLDIASGVAFINQADSSKLRIAASSTHFATSTPSATYYLDLNFDGSWSWATTHSTAANYISIAQATTDGSGNIATVTDVRPLNMTLLSAATGTLTYPAILHPQRLGIGPINTASGNQAIIVGDADAHTGKIWQIVQLQNGGLAFYESTGANTPLELAASGGILQVGGQNVVGNLGVPVIVAQAFAVAVTATTAQTILTFTPPAIGVYRVNFTARVANATSPATISAYLHYNEAIGGGTETVFFTIQGLTTGATNPITLDSASIGSANTIASYAVVIYAGTSSAITVLYQDATATPNDHVTAMIERLS